MYSYISKDAIQFHKANWENQTNQIVQQCDSNRKLQLFKEQKDKFLDIRRKKLSDLLKYEEEIYKKEIIANQETPEQVRLNMESKLNTLLELKEKERQVTVTKMKERKFYADADELRKNDSEAFAIECYLEQENQMLDKLRKRQLEEKQEQIYVKLNELDMKKKEAKEQVKIDIKEKKKKDTYAFLEWQKEQQKESKDNQKNLLNLENTRIRDQWINDNESEENERIDRIIKNNEVYKNIQQFNRQEEDIKKMRTDIEKRKDKELINEIVTKEKALDEIDKREKERKKQEFTQNKKYLEFVMNQKKEAEAWMDQIVKSEADKKWKKDQESWIKQENARIELMKKVYKEREEAIYLKKDISNEIKEAIKKERVVLESEIAEYNKKLQEIAIEDAKKRKHHQEDLIYQMKEKQLLKDKENQDKIYEERAAALWELEYQKRINLQKELHFKRLEEIKERGTNDVRNTSHY